MERVIDFVAKFIPALNKKNEAEGDDGNESDHDDVSDNKLLQEMFDFLLQVLLVLFSPCITTDMERIVN